MLDQTKTLENLLKRREELWDEHPVITARAVLPTPAVKASLGLVARTARRQRGLSAFWAHPLSGKSSCIRVLEAVLARDFSGCGVIVYEAKKKQVIAEGAFLEDILATLDYAPKVQRSLSGKRNQVVRALYTLAQPRGHLFIIIDEAQEMSEQELCWLKAITNLLSRMECRVTTALFGQEELLDLRDMLLSHGRSDLVVRYLHEIFEFENIRNAADLQVAFASCDAGSEYPADSGWSYTQFLWPLAFGGGLTLTAQAQSAWMAFVRASPISKCAQGVSMQWVAHALCELAEGARESDRPSWRPSDEDWDAAIARAGFLDRVPSRKRKRPKHPKATKDAPRDKS